MKTKLLIAAITIATSASAQFSADSTGYLYNTTDAASDCYLNVAPGNGGVMSHGGNFATTGDYLPASGPLTLVGEATVDSAAAAAWFGLPYVDDSDQCAGLNGSALGINMSASGDDIVVVKFESDVQDATLEVFIGGSGQWVPATSSYNTGSGGTILATSNAIKADEAQITTFNLASIDGALWSAWTGKDMIQSVGFRTLTPNATFKIHHVRFGANGDVSTKEVAAKNVSVYPNPATDVLNVKFDATLNSTVELTDLTGKVVVKQSVNAGSNNVAFNTAAVKTGIYFVNIKSANGNVTQKVLVK